MLFADRLVPLQVNVFADMDRAKANARKSGQTIIDLSLGSSDLPTAPHVLDTISEALYDTSTHGYSLFQSTLPFRRTAADWYTRKFGVSVDPETEVLLLIGSQEGTAHLPLAILNPGDFALLTDPGYPSHAGGVHLASGQYYTMPLLAENGFLPQFQDVPPEVLAQSKMMVLSYPHNPTTGYASLAFWEEAVEFCQSHNLVLVHDFPYGDVTYTGEPAPSVLQADRNKATSIEFYSMSKSYNMGGFRVGYAIGNAELITALRQIKATVDFNQYPGIVRGAIAALSGAQEGVQKTVDTFRQRRDTFVEAATHIGWHISKPNATQYLWAKLPDPWVQDSIDFCVQLVEATGVALAPGRGFGKYGEGYVRIALVQSPDVLEAAVQKIDGFLERSGHQTQSVSPL
ncbi:LL-diaminopimelate aminotransferase [Oscillatoria sp. CS-180]|uniref:LL-diaminopimelate aminotransferase n=1 Tax=Oscillatoria sp. CS-180 TaxID=3021720 RepID=UPI00232D0992|nr:LL-diaminopimelate aminotransferase [Oscillatoria sp. CS-180]MDB9527236.1 LL-diaminopimelate aminotransferase [Oscillatoria sp. CS-180]